METSPKWKCISSKKSRLHRNPEVNENAAVKMITETSRRHNPSSLSDSKEVCIKDAFFFYSSSTACLQDDTCHWLMGYYFLKAFLRCVWRTIPTVSSLHYVRVYVLCWRYMWCLCLLVCLLLYLYFLDFFFLILPGALHNPDLFQAPAPGGAEVMSAFSLRLIQSHHRPTVRVSHAASMEGRI